MKAVAIFDWQDGPREGFARLETGHGAWWYFRTLATRFDPDDIDQCLYAFSEVPADDALVLEDEFGAAEGRPIIWPGDPGEVSEGATEVVERVAADAPPPSLVGRVVSSTGCCELWQVYTSFGFPR
ncbi:hypothetical protein [Kitasatospora sp. SUK 42]|uniref:hypothetical protein n=1 Tax=Kitasatospora sp. SUK 42 TaxID=1588882 RepID=UPI0018CADD15|nr:hypothetical protein [Kitasatospora sp. SUK 42]MBV2154929.1 hypothetical protein [Kitasatospora sp. SUK 42]